MAGDGEGRRRFSQADYVAPPISTWRATWLLIRYNPSLFILDAIAYIVVGLLPLGLGVLTGRVFDLLTGELTIALSFTSLIGVLLVVSVVGTVLEYGAFILDFYFAFSLTVLMRKNMMSRVLELPGAQATITAPGEMVSRFAGDARNVRELAIQALQVLRNVVVIIAGLAVMFTIEARVTLVVFLPLVISVALVNVLRRRIGQYRAAARGAEGDVTGFVGELFGAVQAVKVASAEDHIDRRFREVNEARRKTALLDSLFTEFLTVIMQNTTNLSVGLILLLVGQQMAAGTFTIGDFALFVAFLLPVSQALTYFGQLLALHKQAAVSLRRMVDVLQGGSPERLFKRGSVYLTRRSGWPDVPFVRKQAEHKLDTAGAENLSFTYASTGRGIEDVSLNLPRGSFTVVTGRIGSGKTTLLRAFLGLLPAGGKHFWNGQPVEDPGDFFVPPRIAYTGQVPRLFSSTLEDNILLGLPADAVDLPSAIHSAVMEQDIRELEDGLNTMVGTRGVKLSGGQMQRASAARMFIRRPELYVFDDLSSALDVNTEKELWERLLPTNQSPATSHQLPATTCLVVSHRRPALQRADHIIVLKDGKVEDQGKLDELLKRCEEMQRLWQGDLGTPEEVEESAQAVSAD